MKQNRAKRREDYRPKLATVLEALCRGPSLVGPHVTGDERLASITRVLTKYGPDPNGDMSGFSARP